MDDDGDGSGWRRTVGMEAAMAVDKGGSCYFISTLVLIFQGIYVFRQISVT